MAGKTTYITLGPNPQNVAMEDAVTSATDNLVKIAWNKYTPVKPTTDSAVVQQASVEGDSIMQRIESTEDLAIKQRERDLAAYTTGYDYGKMKSDPYYKEVATSKPGKDTTVPAFAQAGVSAERAAAGRKKAINEINPIYGDPTAPAQDNPYDAEAKALRKIQAKNVAEEANTSATHWMTADEFTEHFEKPNSAKDPLGRIKKDERIIDRSDPDYPYMWKAQESQTISKRVAEQELERQAELLRKAGYEYKL
tara:strand:+ start:886 stop:1641 length:756 start_codon:yes stop_codon:yes gene_type:complete